MSLKTSDIKGKRVLFNYETRHYELLENNKNLNETIANKLDNLRGCINERWGYKNAHLAEIWDRINDLQKCLPLSALKISNCPVFEYLPDKNTIKK